ncbi:MAG: phosphoribosylaminoimidazolesuccinocarboxamide synthase [Gammaproteobacteria bacterium]|nr:MAG: phosphoribosylaminoimidazolesuccinocarboxamide synthase [Gammaproteobacteria bacterium]UCH38528.1 MAG: phosphoribosylaminoimidazolesuccinocarboxamide synthase [Gammaproteobacteria bacterium]
MSNDAIFETQIDNLELIGRGKVRDIYAIDAEHMLIVTTDRFSAFDVVFDEPIPRKGELLTEVSNFWFARTADLITNHLSDLDLRDYVSAADYERLRARSIIVRRLETLPVEAIVRGYVIGSGWKDYQASGEICGIKLPPGLQQAEKLPEPIFTPSTKAEVGDHDINVSFEDVVARIGLDKANAIRDKSIEIYRQAADYARERGIIIADTKFEFGVDANDELVLIDEILTPDSSRYWPADEYRVGISPPSYDKQFVRDYLETLDWNKTPPAPKLPAEIVEKTMQKYQQVRDILLG